MAGSLAAQSAGDRRFLSPAAVAALALPIIGLALMLARPELDVHWQHQPSHFWLVLATIGDTTNLGSRLAGVAEPGQAVIGAATRAALGPAIDRGTFSVRSLGQVTVKGKRDPVEAWSLARG